MASSDLYSRKNNWKFMLFLSAVLIGAATLWYTETFLAQLRSEELKRVERFGEAVKSMVNASDQENITFELSFITSNNTIPIIITDSAGNILLHRNLDERKSEREEWLYQRIAEMESEAEPIEVDLGNGDKNIIYYQNSVLLTKLRLYPIVLLVVISLFIVIAYFAFSNSRKAEQNQVWNGLAKETAHQIGTPLTSLVGWLELLREKQTEELMVAEMEKDIDRLKIITERFSKIGSQPKLEPQMLSAVCASVVDYLQARSPRKIDIRFNDLTGTESTEVPLNRALFEWVLENLIRNAIDAIEGGKGFIEVELSALPKYFRLEVSDSGKGMNPQILRRIFKPGFTTKNRGWGLGLSLAKRIIEDYHGGRINVARSEPGKGTTFRIQLKR